MSSLSRELVFLILQFLDEEKFKETVHKLEQESGFFFNMKYFEDEVHNGNWDEVEKYLSGFTKVDDNRYSMKIFFEIRKQKYLEALDKHDLSKAVEILVKDLKVFATFNEELFKEITHLLTLENFRENEQLSKYGDTKSARAIMLVELKKLIEANPLFRDKLQFPNLRNSRLRTLINQSLNWQHQLCKNPRSNPDIKTLFVDHSCGQPNGARAPSPANNPLLGGLPKAGGFPPLGAHGPFQPTPAPVPAPLAGWMSNPSTVTHPAVSVGAIGLGPSSIPAALKHPRTPPTNPSEYPSGDSEHVSKRTRMGISDEVSLPVNVLPVTFPGHGHSQTFNAPDSLPKAVARTLNQGSSPMSMDFHPVQQTLLLVGTNVGDIALWEVGSRERLVSKNFKVWDLTACSMSLQAALVKDPAVSVNRVIWSPDGSLFGVAYSRHIVHIYSYHGGEEVRQHLEIDAHVGGVNDLAFSHPNKQLCVITCGDDKTIKVWDATNGTRQYTFEGHEAPVYSVSPHCKENIQFIFSTAVDGKIKAWLYDNIGSRVDFEAPGRWCTTMAYSADGTRLFSCGTSKDGESFLVEWNESEGAVKRTYQGFRKRSLGVVQFDTTKNRYLAAGDDFSIKFWDMDNVQPLTSIDADGGLPASPCIRFNKDGSLLVVSANDNGIKVLANSDGMQLLCTLENLSYDALRTSEAPKSAQFQHQLGLQQQSNQVQQNMQQRLQASGQTSNSLLQSQNLIDQQKQLYQSQRAVPETSSTSLDSTAQTGQANGGDWQEEVYQKIKVMKETYLPELNEMHQKIAAKLLQHDSLPQQPKSEQLDKLKIFKTMLERILHFLTVSKANIVPAYKEKLSSYEKQIINFINTNRPRKPISAMQQGQLPPPHMQPMQQPQPQINQTQSHDNQMNPQLQSINLQGSMQTMQPNNITSMQHNSLSSLPVASTAQQTMLNSLQPGSNLDPGQGNALGSMQQVATGPLQQNLVSNSQQANISSLSSQSGITVLQQNMNPLQSNSNMLQHQHMKQQQEQQILQSQKYKQQRQMQQQYLQQKQQLMQQQQQLHQQAKQQLPTQLQAHLHQMNDANDMRQGINVKPGVFQQLLPAGQRQPYPHQQPKPGAQYPISSPQLLQAASPQMPQHSSPQIDQQSLLTSISKTGTPLQSANSPFVVPSPSTPLAPSPMPAESEKPIPGTSSLSNAVNVGNQQGTVVQTGSQSLAIGTPGISASPLLAEFTGADGTHANALTTVSSKSSITEQPLERLMKAVKSMSSSALCASVSDIGSVISMTDRIAGSAPGNGSRAAVGEDLVAMTKCRLQARNFITQDGMSGTKKMKRNTCAMPLNVISSAGGINDSFKQLTGSETSDLESTATSTVKRPRIEANHALLEEIREINQRLIDTVVDICDEDVDSGSGSVAATAEGGAGMIVKCSFSAVALSSNLKSQYMSAQMSPIQPLRLLVPKNYPNCSPILLDKFPVEVSKEYEDLSVKAKLRFSISLRSLSQPMSLGEIARTWDVCARAVISEHAQESGGGSFSSKYGTWENCSMAA